MILNFDLFNSKNKNEFVKKNKNIDFYKDLM